MSDPFADYTGWGDEDVPPAKKPVFDGSDTLAVVKSIPAWIPPAPTGAMERPEWDVRLVIDFVFGLSKEAICEAYGFMPHHYDRIVDDVTFLAKVAGLKKELEKDGATFTLKAKLQAEALIDESFKMAMDSNTDPRVRAKLIGDTVRWAGFDKTGASADGTGGFSININLNGKSVGSTFEGEVTDV